MKASANTFEDPNMKVLPCAPVLAFSKKYSLQLWRRRAMPADLKGDECSASLKIGHSEELAGKWIHLSYFPTTIDSISPPDVADQAEFWAQELRLHFPGFILPLPQG
jgi:hypothetical protein